MRVCAHTAFLACAVVLAGCAGSDGKYGDPRGQLDRSIYYVEKDRDNRVHPLSGTDASKKTVSRVPLRAVVDLNSTIQILVDKEKLAQGAPSASPVSEPEGLLQRKKDINTALVLIEEVVKARLELIAAHQQRDFAKFQRAAKERATRETQLMDKLTAIWPETSETYRRLDQEDYDPPSFTKLQALLSKEIAAVDAADRAYEEQLKARQRTLSIEAFLNTRGKEDTVAAAIHVDGYDAIKEQSLATRDRFGLDLSPVEYAKLKDQVEATQKFAASFERLRRGEATLNETVGQIRSKMAPEIGRLLEEAEFLAKRLSSSELAARRAKTQELLNAYLKVISDSNERVFEERRAALQAETDALLTLLKDNLSGFASALTKWIQDAKALRGKWESPASAADLLGLIKQTSDLARSFEQFRESLPELESEAEKQVSAYFDKILDELEKQLQVLSTSTEAAMLRSSLQEYYRDFRRVVILVQQVLALRRVEVDPIAEMPPSTSSSFNVPLEDIKDTYVDLEVTPRLVGDVVTIKATLRDDTKKAVDTSTATFRMGRYGYYADLSPAVVLVKPNELAGGDDGFRFAPTLSWMHHWAPRPEETRTWASIRRSLDPAIGIHSAFLNFNSTTSSDSVQIGIGATLSLWKDRLQFGLGFNLMARSDDEGRRYFFIGSDLIGLLQAIGVGK